MEMRIQLFCFIVLVLFNTCYCWRRMSTMYINLGWDDKLWIKLCSMCSDILTVVSLTIVGDIIHTENFKCAATVWQVNNLCFFKVYN